MLRTAVFVLTTSIILSSAATAQNTGPIVVPERIQQLAFDYPLVVERLGIKWDTASPEDIGRYIGFLAAANEIANAIAVKNDRSGKPSDDDYLAAFAALCIFPNKPPIAEPYWPQAFAAFSNQAIRDKLQAAVGPLAVSLPASLASGEGKDVVQYKWPTDQKAYFNEVLNLESLSDGK